MNRILGPEIISFDQSEPSDVIPTLVEEVQNLISSGPSERKLQVKFDVSGDLGKVGEYFNISGIRDECLNDLRRDLSNFGVNVESGVSDLSDADIDHIDGNIGSAGAIYTVSVID